MKITFLLPVALALNTGCMSMLEDASSRKHLENVINEQSAPFFALEAELKGKGAPKFEDMQSKIRPVEVCLGSIADVLTMAPDGGKPYMSLNDKVPTSAGTMTLKAYYGRCMTLAKKISKYQYSTCGEQKFELRATGSHGSFGGFAVYSGDQECHSMQTCYEHKHAKAEDKNYKAAACGGDVSETIPADFATHKAKAKKVCGDAMVVFTDDSFNVGKHNYNRQLDVKTAKFKCVKAKAKTTPFAAELNKYIDAVKERDPKSYKALAK